MMFRSLTLWAFLIAGAGWALFHTSYRVQTLEGKLAKINRDISEETQGIQVLKAEWSYLNAPTHLQMMVQDSALPLQPTKASQIGTIDSIPQKPAPSSEMPQVAMLATPSLPAKALANPPLQQVADARLVPKAHAVVQPHTISAEPHIMPASLTMLLARVEKMNSHPTSPPR